MELLDKDKHDCIIFSTIETLIPLADYYCTFILLPVYDLHTNLLTGVNSLDTMHSHASSRLQRKRQTAKHSFQPH